VSHLKSFPLVSVIIPTFNRSEFLPRAIRSVLQQTFQDFELVIVDDGSTDKTFSQIKAFNDKRIRYIFQTNHGVSSARNLGIRNSTGTFLAFLDSDDEWMPVKLEKQLEALENHPGYLIVHTDEMWFRNNRRLNQKHKHRKYGGWIFRHCLPLCVISPSSILLHRKIFSDIGSFNETLPVCEDYELWLRMASRYPVLFIDKPLLKKYGGHSGQLSSKYWGMDIFRAKALSDRITSGDLSPRQEMLARKELARKYRILEKGFSKRGKKAEASNFGIKARRCENVRWTATPGSTILPAKAKPPCDKKPCSVCSAADQTK
jgi:glycosyltransferase involved in cell wall biosynthesis